jgi:hypothetical protein
MSTWQEQQMAACNQVYASYNSYSGQDVGFQQLAQNNPPNANMQAVTPGMWSDADVAELKAKNAALTSQLRSMQARMIEITGQLLAARIGTATTGPSAFPARALRGGDGVPR